MQRCGAYECRHGAGTTELDGEGHVYERPKIEDRRSVKGLLITHDDHGQHS